MKKSVFKAVSLLLAFSLLVCVFTPAFAESSKDETPFRISVSVNGDTGTQRGFTWYTKDNTDSLIEINCENAKITYKDVTEWQGNYCHQAVVAGLTPGETYEYTVGSKAVQSDKGTFTTDNKDSEVNFIAIADVQASSEENFTKGLETLLAAEETMPDADFTVNLGDFTNESDNTEWDAYDKVFGKANMDYTIAPVAGNHDGFNRPYWFNNMFCLDTTESVQVKNGVNYSFDYGNCHIAVLNTNDMMCVTLAQMKWLKNDMNGTDKDWKIVAMHKSPYTLGKDGKWPDALYLSKSLTKVFDECGVDLVMSGHDHQYIRTKALKNNKVSEDGTVYVLAGTAGSKRYEIRKFLAGTYMRTSFINTMIIQKNGYGNYWDGEGWDNTDEKNIGGCFNTVSVNGGRLTFNSYILSDELTNADGSRLITNTDTFTLTKETGKNKITFTGDNTTSEAEYNLSIIPSFCCLAVYAFGEWLPKFLYSVPAILKSVIVDDTF